MSTYNFDNDDYIIHYIEELELTIKDFKRSSFDNLDSFRESLLIELQEYIDALYTDGGSSNRNPIY